MSITVEWVKELLVREEKRFVEARPRCLALYEEARKNYVGGVPMSWMRIWSGGVPIFVDRAEGIP